MHTVGAHKARARLPELPERVREVANVLLVAEKIHVQTL